MGTRRGSSERLDHRIYASAATTARREACRARSRLLFHDPNLRFVSPLGLIKTDQVQGEPWPGPGFQQRFEKDEECRLLYAVGMRFHSSRPLPYQRHTIGVLSTSVGKNIVPPSLLHAGLSNSKAALPPSTAATMRLLRRATFLHFEHDFSRTGLILWQNKSFADTVLALQSTVYEIFL
jgi:hypothetical protein